MTTVQVKMELPFDELLSAVEQLNLPDLEQFVGQILKLQARRRASSLSLDEAELLLKINQGIPADLQARCNELIAKRQTETLRPDEHKELIRLTDQFEELNAVRLEHLTELALLRQTSLPTLMKELGIQVPVVV